MSVKISINVNTGFFSAVLTLNIELIEPQYGEHITKRQWVRYLKTLPIFIYIN